MNAPDKIYLVETTRIIDEWRRKPSQYARNIEYIRKEALLEWAEKELDRLYELIPDASNENPSQMELRYLGQYMQTEILIDKLNSL